MTQFSLKAITRFDYTPSAIEKGYANQTLHIDLSEPAIRKPRPVTESMKDVFVGGKGFDLWLLWQAVSGDNPVERS